MTKQQLVYKKKGVIKEKLALNLLKKQLQNIQLKEILFLSGFIIGGALLRVPMQVFPSIEPITFFAVLSGWLFGWRKGFLTGAAGLWISNFFVFGGQGPWTLFQVGAFGIAGVLGGLLRKKANLLETCMIMIGATLVFEIVMTLNATMFLAGNIFAAFVIGLPFTFAHLISNGVFGLFLGKAKKYAEKKGKFNEKEICIDTIKHFRNNTNSV